MWISEVDLDFYVSAKLVVVDTFNIEAYSHSQVKYSLPCESTLEHSPHVKIIDCYEDRCTLIKKRQGLFIYTYPMGKEPFFPYDVVPFTMPINLPLVAAKLFGTSGSGHPKGAMRLHSVVIK